MRPSPVALLLALVLPVSAGALAGEEAPSGGGQAAPAPVVIRLKLDETGVSLLSDGAAPSAPLSSLAGRPPVVIELELPARPEPAPVGAPPAEVATQAPLADPEPLPAEAVAAPPPGVLAGTEARVEPVGAEDARYARAPLAPLAGAAGAQATIESNDMLLALATDLRQERWDLEGGVRGAYARACTAGYGPACNPTWSHPEGGNLAEAAAVFEPFCDGGDRLACVVMAWSLEAGDPVAAADLHVAGCVQGFGRACTELGLLYARGLGAEASETLVTDEAFALFEAGCDDGDLLGCSRLADRYYHGRGAGRDECHAARLADQACGGGYLPACSNVAFLLARGSCGETDPVRATSLARLSCESGYKPGCDVLATLLGTAAAPEVASAAATGETAVTGTGAGTGAATVVAAAPAAPAPAAPPVPAPVPAPIAASAPADPRAAVSWYQAACQAGSADGCLELGACFENGRGVGQDLVVAASLYGKACEDGVAAGCTRMGRLYESGVGVGPDPARAYALYQYACGNGDSEACRSLESVKR